MGMIKGQTVTLTVKTISGTDNFGANVYTTSTVSVPNVICEPASNDAIIEELQLSGKRIAYTLHIPKGDTNDWKDTIVSFNGETYKTFGDCLVYDENLTPLDWNKKVKVERYE